MLESNRPAMRIMERLKTLYLGEIPNSFALMLMNTLPVGGFGAVGRCHVWFQAVSVSASITRLRAASGMYVNE